MKIFQHRSTTKINLALGFFILAISQLMVSCNWPEESPNLVNPPLKSPTIGIRYLNLSGGMDNRTLRLNTDGKIENVPYGTMSLQKNPPADSVFLTIEKNGATEFTQKKPLKFLTRNVNYTFISISSPKGAKKYRETDTMVWLSTSLINPTNNYEAMLRLFNGVPDSTVSYSVRFGCPNGASIITAMLYGATSTKFAYIRSGEIPVSILKHKGGETTIIGVYKLNLQAKGQYCLIVLPYNDTEIVYLYDELSKLDNAMKPADLIVNKEADLRILNFSSQNYSIKTGQDEVVVDNIDPKMISNYKNVKACDSQNNDYIIINGASGTDTITASFEVMGKYNCLIADTKDTPGGKKILIPPLYFPTKNSDEAIIRVVHTAWKHGAITLSLGMRNTAQGTKAGECLAKGLEYGDISAPINLPAGFAPLTTFSSTEPAQLLNSALGKFEAGKSYLVVIGSTTEGYDKTYIIEEGDQAQAINPIPSGVFTQIVAAAADVDNISFNLYVDGTQYLKDITIPTSGIAATVLPEGTATIISGGVEHTTNTSAFNRLLLVVSGDRSKLNIFDVNTTPLYTGSNFYRRRFLNAVYTLPEMAVKEDKDYPPNLAKVIATSLYGKISEISTVYLDSRKSFRFFDNSTSKEIIKVGDLSFSYNKSYSIIFAGSAPTGYSVIIVQEF